MENVIPKFLSNFILKSETTSLLSDNINELSQIHENCETLILNKPMFSENVKNYGKIQKSIKSIAIVGDGDTRFAGELFISFLKRLLGEETTLECLILINLEISPEDFENILGLIKNHLKALQISRVPLEKAHFDILNKIEFHLEFFSLSHFQADEKDAFNNSPQKNSHEKNSSIELNFQNCSANLKYFEFKGSRLTQETFDSLRSKFSDSLQHLILEKIDSQENITKAILLNIKDFSQLKTFSLNGNCLKNIDFCNLEKEIKNTQQNKDINVFPKTLNTLNLNSTEMNSKQIQEVINLLKKSNCCLRALHFESCHIYPSEIPSILDLLNQFNKSKTLTIEITSLALENTETEKVSDDKTQTSSTGLLQNNQNLFPQLLQNHKELISILPNQIPTTLSGLRSILTNEDCKDYFPVFLKMLLEIKLFQKVMNFGEVEFIKDPRVLLPKNNFQKALKSNKDSTINVRDLQSIGLYKEPLVFRIHPQVLKDKDLASLSIQDQRENLKEILAKLGFGCREFSESDSIVNEFIVLLEDTEYIGWDYRLATFSLRWYDSLNLVVVKFNLSDDWFMERSERKNVYALKNMDFLINAFSEWNIKPLDYIFGLEILKDGETEVEFHHQIMKYGDMNLSKSIIMALDKGFIILKALQRESLFNRDDFSQTAKDAKQIRKIFKAQLKSYSQSDIVANL